MFGLRAARLAFHHPQTGVEVTIFPMVHIGERQFYKRAYKDAFEHDVVLYEGVRTRRSKLITASYRWLNLERLGLVVQPSAAEFEGPARSVHADIAPEELRALWQRMPLWLRALVAFGGPAFGMYGRFTASRDSIAKGMTKDLLRDPDDILDQGDEFEPLRDMISHARDRRLIETLTSELGAAAHSTRIAIVYGAGHVAPVVRALTRQGFSTRPSEWMTIFSLD